jgi:hypothetical protein
VDTLRIGERRECINSSRNQNAKHPATRAVRCVDYFAALYLFMVIRWMTESLGSCKTILLKIDWNFPSPQSLFSHDESLRVRPSERMIQCSLLSERRTRSGEEENVSEMPEKKKRRENVFQPRHEIAPSTLQTAVCCVAFTLQLSPKLRIKMCLNSSELTMSMSFGFFFSDFSIWTFH